VGDGDTEQGDQAGLRGTSCLAVTALVGRSTESHTDPLRLNQRLRGDPMDAIIILAIVLVPPFSPSCSTGASTRPIGRAGVTPIGNSHIGIGALACSTCVGATAAEPTAAEAVAEPTAAGAAVTGAAVTGAAALADVRWS
jgi:hypothetical protein